MGEWLSKQMDVTEPNPYEDLPSSGVLPRPTHVGLLSEDPRSPTSGIDRTPISVGFEEKFRCGRLDGRFCSKSLIRSHPLAQRVVSSTSSNASLASPDTLWSQLANSTTVDPSSSTEPAATSTSGCRSSFELAGGSTGASAISSSSYVVPLLRRACSVPCNNNTADDMADEIRNIGGGYANELAESFTDVTSTEFSGSQDFSEQMGPPEPPARCLSSASAKREQMHPSNAQSFTDPSARDKSNPIVCSTDSCLDSSTTATTAGSRSEMSIFSPPEDYGALSFESNTASPMGQQIEETSNPGFDNFHDIKPVKNREMLTLDLETKNNNMVTIKRTSKAISVHN